MQDLNLELRSLVLDYSLNLENEINQIFIIFFNVDNAVKSRNFGSKAGVSFQNKVDLLYDLGIISKTDIEPLELIMIFRNRFLHNIKYNSFTIMFQDLDNSIVNRLKKYSHDVWDSEESYILAFKQLNLNALSVLNNIHKSRNDKNNEKLEILMNHVKDINSLKILFYKYLHEYELKVNSVLYNQSSIEDLREFAEEKKNEIIKEGELEDGTVKLLQESEIIKSIFK